MPLLINNTNTNTDTNLESARKELDRVTENAGVSVLGESYFTSSTSVDQEAVLSAESRKQREEQEKAPTVALGAASTDPAPFAERTETAVTKPETTGAEAPAPEKKEEAAKPEAAAPKLLNEEELDLRVDDLYHAMEDNNGWLWLPSTDEDRFHRALTDRNGDPLSDEQMDQLIKRFEREHGNFDEWVDGEFDGEPLAQARLGFHRGNMAHLAQTIKDLPVGPASAEFQAELVKTLERLKPEQIASLKKECPELKEIFERRLTGADRTKALDLISEERVLKREIAELKKELKEEREAHNKETAELKQEMKELKEQVEKLTKALGGTPTAATPSTDDDKAPKVKPGVDDSKKKSEVRLASLDTEESVVKRKPVTEVELHFDKLKKNPDMEKIARQYNEARLDFDVPEQEKKKDKDGMTAMQRLIKSLEELDDTKRKKMIETAAAWEPKNNKQREWHTDFLMALSDTGNFLENANRISVDEEGLNQQEYDQEIAQIRTLKDLAPRPQVKALGEDEKFFGVVSKPSGDVLAMMQRVKDSSSLTTAA